MMYSGNKWLSEGADSWSLIPDSTHSSSTTNPFLKAVLNEHMFMPPTEGTQHINSPTFIPSMDCSEAWFLYADLEMSVCSVNMPVEGSKLHFIALLLLVLTELDLSFQKMPAL